MDIKPPLHRGKPKHCCKRTGEQIYLDSHNTRRTHSSLDGQIPETIYYAGLVLW